MRVDCEEFKRFVIDSGYELKVESRVYSVNFGEFSIFVPHTDWLNGRYNGEKGNVNIYFYTEEERDYTETDGLMPEDGVNFLRDLIIWARFHGY